MVSASSEVSSSLEEDVSEAPELAEALGDDVTVVDDGVVECAAVSVESCELQPLRRVVPISTVVKRHIHVISATILPKRLGISCNTSKRIPEKSLFLVIGATILPRIGGT